MVACNAPTPCPTWMDHIWGEEHWVKDGKHETMGRYQQFLVTCTRCGRETTATRWLDILDRPTFEPLPNRRSR